MEQQAGKIRRALWGNIRGIIFPAMLTACCSFANIATAQTAPAFTGGAEQNLSVCMNTSAAVSTLLSVNDPDVGETETWSVLAMPMHGTLSGFSTSVITTGSTITPSGLSYSPNTGYFGADTFMIEASDGMFSASTMIVVNVRAIPTLSSTASPAGICDNALFTYTPVSATSGASFNWTRSFVPGIANAPASGSGSVTESLDNTTYYPLNVTYRYTISAGGCSSVRNVVVSVAPAPTIVSSLADTTCNGSVFGYTPVIGTSGAAYTWERAMVAGISPATASGSGPISETLNSSASSPVNVVYTFTLTAGGCTNIQNLEVTVAPAPPLTSITTASPATVCAGTGYQNFGAGIMPPSGITYNWSAVNAVINGVGNTGQYSLVSFPNPGAASVTLHIGGSSALCVSNSTYNVTVGASSPSGAPVIYYNYQFIYQDNTQDSYQWGYDNAITLDSTIVPGATFQSYPVTAPDFVHNYYWVITEKDGCRQKTYYNMPLAITKVHEASLSMQVYPNPATEMLNVELNNINGNPVVSISDMTGRILKTQTGNGNIFQLAIGDLPAGCYIISCSQNGLKSATVRFTKN